jgi:hypothetical protein
LVDFYNVDAMNRMKKMVWLGVIILFTSLEAWASIEIFCPKQKEISYSTYLAGKYYDRPVVWGAHTLYGPWIKSSLSCQSGYVDVKWEIVDSYSKSYYCTQTIWVSGSGYSSAISVWCPKEETIYCDEVDYYRYAKPEVTGYHYSISGPWVSKNLNECGVGSIWVEWKITDGCGKIYKCKQAVWVKARPSKLSVWWPKDFDADACKDEIDPKRLPWPYGYPEINGGNKCGKYGINYKDEEFTFPNDPGICRKIIRKWTIIDWCTYNPNGYGNYQKEGIWQYNQVIKILSKSRPGISCPGTITSNAEQYQKTAWIDIPIPTITNSCNGQARISHNSPYATKLSGGDASGLYPIGTTWVVFTVTDACSNNTQCSTKVVVADKAAPTPYCIASLITGIGWHSDGIYTIIDAKKFDIGSFDNCTPREKLKFTAEPARLTCDSLGIRNIKIWVEDEAGNKDFCRVKINLQDNMKMCPQKPINPVISKDTLIIAGLITTYDDKPIDSVQVLLTDTSQSMKMAKNGAYKFDALSAKRNYTLKPQKTNQFLHQVDNDDYTLLTDFVQGKVEFTHPLQYIAADIDGDDTISIEDAYLLGYYILNKGLTLPGQASWRFLPIETNLLDISVTRHIIKKLPTVRTYNPLDSTTLHADFYGVKIGDINLSSLVPTGSLTQEKSGTALETRSIPNSTNITVAVFPNPFKEQVQFSIMEPQGGPTAQLSVFTMTGQLVFENKKTLNKGLNTWSLQQNYFPSSGSYFFRISRGGSVIKSGLLIHQH